MNISDAEIDPTLTIDPQHPWIGLASYSEETRSYFHGRDEEAAELARRVQRKPLTVLFGQSGLGKTSLLRAGLVPRLRGEGFCPVYVRIDYAPESPPPAEQIKQAIFRATAASGHWSRPGAAIEGESLWEFLHHRGDLLRDADGRPLLPLLIFDQFEEIFTLGQSDDAGRLRARQFLEDLADLVENRPPAALEARLEEDEADAEQFDFARADYRILIALREDYLAHLESLKGIMPSVTQNRMRLARMNGAQALSAVLQPGGRLVSQEVAEAIVRFVAGGSELSNAEVEPSLLSLVCRELNNARIARGAAEISVGLLAGSRDTILTEFYERALADQPAGVRRVIEDELLTESGHRESLAEERVQKALAAEGADPDALIKLVNRRLLRIEERLDVRRVELTHDVLCSVVRASRDLRQEREARDEAQRNLLAQQARVAATRRALVRARTVAAVSVVLMLVAGASAVFGWVNFNRARTADAEAQQARQLADHARTEAESLVSFLIEDFYEELEPTGRLEIMASLAGRAVAYYEGLPEALVTPATRLNHGMALVREGFALGIGGDRAGAAPRIDRGLAIFESLQEDPRYRDQAHFGIGLALYSRHIGNLSPATAEADVTRVAALLRPMAESPGASRKTRFLYAEALHGLSYTLRDEARIEATEQARTLVAGMGALDLSDLAATSIYADVTDSQSRHTLALGRVDEAAALSLEMYGLVEQVLGRRPGDLRALQNRFYAADTLSLLAQRRFDLAAALDFAERAEQAGEDLVRFNPSSLGSWTSWAQGKVRVAAVLERQGRIADAISMYRSATALAQDDRAPPDFLHQLRGAWVNLAHLEAGLGRTALAREAFAQSAVGYEAQVERLPEGSDILLVSQLAFEAQQAQMELLLGDSRLANEKARSVAERAAALGPEAPPQRNAVLRAGLAWTTDSALRVGRYAEAESAARARLEVEVLGATGNDPVDLDAETRVGLAHAIAWQGRPAEALEALEPAMARFRELWRADIRETRFQRNFAHALYVTAIVQPADAAGQARRQAALAEAADVLAAVPAEARRMSDIRAVAEWIEAAGR
jgi:tetratricopeptide (TPR) repeat protein